MKEKQFFCFVFGGLLIANLFIFFFFSKKVYKGNMILFESVFVVTLALSLAIAA